VNLAFLILSESFQTQFSGIAQLPEALLYQFCEFTAMLCLHDEDYILFFTFFDISSSCLHMGTTDGGSFIFSDTKRLFQIFMQINLQLVGVRMDVKKMGKVNTISYILPLVQYHVTLTLA
jgi:hypothetical protein